MKKIGEINMNLIDDEKSKIIKWASDKDSVENKDVFFNQSAWEGNSNWVECNDNNYISEYGFENTIELRKQLHEYLDDVKFGEIINILLAATYKERENTSNLTEESNVDDKVMISEYIYTI